jgi:hypothetical protein
VIKKIHIFFILNNLVDKSIKTIHHSICGCRCNERLKVETDGSTSLRYTGLRPMYEYRCDERLKARVEGSTRVVTVYTGLCGGLEHLKIETRLTDESFGCVRGECVI